MPFFTFFKLFAFLGLNQARNFLKHLKYSSLHTSKLSLFQKLIPENLRSQKRMKIPNKVDLTL